MHRVYEAKNLVDSYDDHHFGGESGKFVFNKDVVAINSLLGKETGLILDIPCGTGIYTDYFTKKGLRFIAADASFTMLLSTGNRQPLAPRILGDINHLPIVEDALDAVIIIRLFQHYSKSAIVDMLKEVNRSLKPGGRVIFDTFRWTPRPYRGPDRLGICVYSNQDVFDLVDKAGLKVENFIAQYLFSPIYYRKLPIQIVNGLDWIEQYIPKSWLLRTFWLCTSNS